MSYNTSNIPVANYAELPATGVKGVIYITEDDDAIYRWNGSSYVSLSTGGSGGGTTENVIYASVALGTVGSADLTEGSNTFGADYTTQLQALINNAGDYSHIIIDGRYSCTGLSIPSNRHITLEQDCGLILRDGSDFHLLYTVNRDASSLLANNITIDGPGILNCNGWSADYLTPQQAETDVNGNFVVGMHFVGANNITFKDFTILNTRNFAILFLRWANVVIDGITVNTGGPDDPSNIDFGNLHCDGIDLCGAGYNALIQNCTVHAQDDHFALAPTGEYSTSAPSYTDAQGSQSKIRMYNNYISGGRDAVRILPGSGFTCDDFVCDGLYGYTKCYWLICVPYNGASGFNKNITFKNIDVDVKGVSSSFYGLYNPIQGQAVIGGEIQDIYFENIKGTITGLTDLFTITQGAVIKDFHLIGYKTEFIEDGFSKNVIKVSITGTVQNLHTSDIALRRPYGYQSILVRNDGVVNKWVGTDMSLEDAYIGFFTSSSGVTNMIQVNGIDFTGQSLAGNPAFILNSSTIPTSQVTVSNYMGIYPINSGTAPTITRGDAFISPPSNTGTSVNVDFTGSSGIDLAGGWTWVYKPGGSATYGNLGKANIGIPSGQDGTIFTEFDGSAKAANIGVLTSNLETGFAGFNAGFAFDGAGVLYWIEGGSAGAMTGNLNVGDLVGLRRTGSTWTLVRSVDRGITWATVAGHSFAYAGTGKAWVVADLGGTSYSGKMVRVRGINLS